MSRAGPEISVTHLSFSLTGWLEKGKRLQSRSQSAKREGKKLLVAEQEKIPTENPEQTSAADQPLLTVRLDRHPIDSVSTRFRIRLSSSLAIEECGGSMLSS